MSDDDLKAEDAGEDEGKPEGCPVTHSEILDALKDRTDWERKQEVWDTMRHEGVLRTNLPWPGAAKMHFPLGDMQVEKIKPVYTQQIYSSELIAAFTPMTQEATAKANAAAAWFDYHIKQRSNFEDIRPIFTDRMCQNGRSVVRVRWDAKRKRVVFECPRPLDIIVPSATAALEEADWIVLVQTFSKAAYLRAGVYKKDADTLAKISGGNKDADQRQQREDSYRRAGITHSDTKGEIIVWVVHEREGDGWKIRTYSPACPELELRKPFTLAYTEGDFKDGAPPFAAFGFEKKDELFYGPRGIMEKVAPFEQSLNHDWNTIKDHQTISTKPVLSRKDGVKNAANVRFRPGDILPFEVSVVQFPEVPRDLRQGMAETRQVAEQLVGSPDFGIGGQRNPGGNKTATEVQAIGAVAGIGAEERARVFRREFAKLLRLAWALLCQYGKEELCYRHGDMLQQLDADALKPELYSIEPSASGDTFTRDQRAAKAMQRYMQFKGDPYINQAELRRDVLESDTPGLVKRLFVMPENTNAEQFEDQAVELTMMMEVKFPAAVSEIDDDATHLACIAGFLERRSALKEPLDEEQLLLVAQHAQAHAAALKEKNPKALGEFKELLDMLERVAAKAQQALAAKQQQQQQQQPGAPAPVAA